MRVAISYWQNCIAPVFDVSQSILLVDVINNQVTDSTIAVLDSDLPFTRANKLSDWGVEILVCNAISQASKMAVAGQNIEIISYVFGPLEDILQAFSSGQLKDGGNDALQVCRKGPQRKRRRHRGK